MKTLCCHGKKTILVDNKLLCGNHSCTNYLGAAEMIRRFDGSKILASFAVFFLFLVFTIEDYSMGDENPGRGYRNTAPESLVPLTFHNLKKELELQKIVCPAAVLAQIRLESANFNSALLKRTNNMLGMRYPVNRSTTACGIYLTRQDTIIYGSQEELRKFRKENNYAVYKSWKDAVSDYSLWQQYTFRVEERYLDFLGMVYAEDTLYVKKIKQLTIE